MRLSALIVLVILTSADFCPVTRVQNPGKVREGNAYSQETRKMILTMSRVSKLTPQGKTLLKDVSLGMYLGAKIGILGANGAGKRCSGCTAKASHSAPQYH